MPRHEVVKAVEGRLEARWTSEAAILARAALNLPGCPFFGINIQGDTPEDGSVFGEVQFPIANTAQMDLGATYYREEGTIRLIVNAARPNGLDAGLMLVDMLADLFRSKKFDGVQTFVPSGSAIDDRNDSGNYFPISISIPFQFDFRDFSEFRD